MEELVFLTTIISIFVFHGKQIKIIITQHFNKIFLLMSFVFYQFSQ